MENEYLQLKQLCSEYEKKQQNLKNAEQKIDKEGYYSVIPGVPEGLFWDYLKTLAFKKFLWVALFAFLPISIVIFILFTEFPVGSTKNLVEFIFISLAGGIGGATIGRIAITFTWGVVLYPLFIIGYLITNAVSKPKRMRNIENIKRDIRNTLEKILNETKRLPKKGYNAAVSLVATYIYSFFRLKVNTASRASHIETISVNLYFFFGKNGICLAEKINDHYDKILDFDESRLEKINDFPTKCIIAKQVFDNVKNYFSKDLTKDSSGTDYKIEMNFFDGNNPWVKVRHNYNEQCFNALPIICFTYTAKNGNYQHRIGWN
ncbi:MAG: hypothetical protein IJ308_03065 [Clostridia bacterium]|nr:hypothetical protein [Clostridia bacterium]